MIWTRSESKVIKWKESFWGKQDTEISNCIKWDLRLLWPQNSYKIWLMKNGFVESWLLPLRFDWLASLAKGFQRVKWLHFYRKKTFKPETPFQHWADLGNFFECFFLSQKKILARNDGSLGRNMAVWRKLWEKTRGSSGAAASKGTRCEVTKRDLKKADK